MDREQWINKLTTQLWRLPYHNTDVSIMLRRIAHKYKCYQEVDRKIDTLFIQQALALGIKDEK